MTRSEGRHVPGSGSSALAAAALVQAVLGTEFVLGGLDKLADPRYVVHFRDFAAGSAALVGGPLAALLRWLVLPNVAMAAQLARATELGAGLVLVLVAVEVARRRLGGRLGARHGYEPAVALAGALAALVLGGLSLVIYLLQGGAPPRVNAAYAFGPPIAIELFNVPIALAVAWMELARFLALRRATGFAPRPPTARRAAQAAVAGLLVLVLAACGGGGGAGGGGGTAQPSGSTKVAMSEFKFTPNAIDVKAGGTLFLVNDGSVAHDMVVTDPGGAVKARSSLVQAGNSATFSLGNLPAGTYQVLCDLPGHKAAGMTGTLVVS
ncbi:MAG TPA: plastocyanin/azurin family copper-binding protein [Candidatus Dormibacteraeota bacterium]|nr:plastocyanin/azurin family copper-binding protein [Candidatus Dormibacteraeota bacterium]